MLVKFAARFVTLRSAALIGIGDDLAHDEDCDAAPERSTNCMAWPCRRRRLLLAIE
jgi:hypothetical protein